MKVQPAEWGFIKYSSASRQGCCDSAQRAPFQKLHLIAETRHHYDEDGSVLRVLS